MNAKYNIDFSLAAYADMKNLEEYIEKQCHAPLTAARQFKMLDELLNWLEEYAELPAVNVGLSIQYGKIIRTVRFGKKMAIVYSIESNIVIVERIMPQSMILV